MSTPPLLHVEDLAKYFPVSSGVFGREVAQVKAVDGVSFELEARRTLGLVGESGCGKTTVGQCIVRLLEPTGGRIVFQGRDLSHESMSELRELRRDLQIIFQDPFGSLNPRMTVADIVGEAVEVHGLASGSDVERRVFETLARVGIPAAWSNRYPHEFSGGQRQRISIARAIALEPKLVICDEAVSALDVSIQAQVINLLIDLQRDMGLSYLFISHDLSVVRHISDDVAVMYLGQIVEHAPTEDLFACPGHPYSRSLLSAIPVADPTRRIERVVLEGDVPTPLDPPSGCRFHTRCPAAFERCAAEEPPALPVGPREVAHRVKCWHGEGLDEDPEWFRVISERTDTAMHALRSRASESPPASRFALAARRERVARPGAEGSSHTEPAPRVRGRGPAEGLPLHARVAAVGAGIGLAAMAMGAPWLGGLWASLFFFAGVLPGREPRARWVVSFVALLAMGAVASSAFSSRAQLREAREQLALLESEIGEVSRARGEAPTRLADLAWRLAALTPAQASSPLDPWGGRWLYRAPGAGGRPFDLGSFGPDGLLGGGDDLGHPFLPGRAAEVEERRLEGEEAEE